MWQFDGIDKPDPFGIVGLTLSWARCQSLSAFRYRQAGAYDRPRIAKMKRRKLNARNEPPAAEPEMMVELGPEYGVIVDSSRKSTPSRKCGDIRMLRERPFGQRFGL